MAYIRSCWHKLAIGRKYAIILTAVVLILGIMLGTFLGYKSAEAHRLQSVQTLSVAAKMLALHLEEYMNRLIDDLEHLGQLLTIVPGDSSQDVLQNFAAKRPELVAIQYQDRQRNLSWGQWLGEQAALTFSGRKQQLLKTAHSNEGEALVEIIIENPYGIVCAQVNLSELSKQQRLLDIQLGKSGHPYLLDSKGVIISHQNLEYIGEPLNQLILESEENDLDLIASATFSLLDYTKSGEERMTGMIPLQKLGLIVGFSQAKQEIKRPAVRLRWTLLLSTFAVISILIGVALYLGRMFTKFLQQLVAKIHQVEPGHIYYLKAQDNYPELKLVSDAVNKLITRLQDMAVATINTLALVLEAKDGYTNQHSQRVAAIACLIAKTMGYEGKDLAILERAAKLHDIGKIAIPDSILLKPSALSKDERKLIQTHPDVAGRILSPLVFLQEEILIIRQHHEYVDGSGYPQGLTGEDIHPLAKILIVADAYEAMTANRPYRKALSHHKALERLHQGKGTQFDPAVVDAFALLMEKGLVYFNKKYNDYEPGAAMELGNLKELPG